MTSLAAQWLRFFTSNAGGLGSIPGWETKILHTAKPKKKKKIKHNLKKKIHTWVPLGNMLGSPGNSEAAPIQRLSGLEEELKPLFILCLLCPFPSTTGGKPSFYSLCKSNSRNFRAV